VPKDKPIILNEKKAEENKNKEIDKNSKKKIHIGILIFRIISLIIIIVCLVILYRWHLENEANKDVSDSLLTEDTISEDHISINPGSTIQEPTETEKSQDNDENDVKTVKVNFDNLISQNSDTVGWIYINSTNINFPVVKSSNNDFYLRHNFKKEYNSAGWIYADYRNNFDDLDQNTIVYGHNRRNGTMFSNLKFYLKNSFAKANNAKYFTFNTKSQNYIAEIYSVYKINASLLSFSNNFNSVDEYQAFIDKSISQSAVDFETQVSTNDKTLTLCTCDDNTIYRIVVNAKLIPILTD